ncbi:MAG: hypothetical protein V3S06_01690, partial [candidate division Zixibacteria bacterium]
MSPYSWIIAALPLLASILIIFFFNRSNKLSSYFSISMVLLSFVLSVIILVEVIKDPTPREYWIEWVVLGDGGMTGTEAINLDQGEPDGPEEIHGIESLENPEVKSLLEPEAQHSESVSPIHP